MKKKDNFFASAHYVAPGCKVVEIRVRRVVCGSYGVGGIKHIGADSISDDSEDWE